MSLTLFKREWKASWKLLAIFAAVLSLYGGMIISMFDPKLGESLNLMAESMPQLFAAFNMTDPGVTLLDFTSNYLYGFLLLVFPLVFIALAAVRLVARKTESGSLACLLASPVPRWKLALTQSGVLLSGVLALVAYVTVLVVAVSGVLFPEELDVKRFLALNAGLLGLLVLFSGLCFFASCLCNTAAGAAGLGAGLSVVFVLIQMIGQVGDKFEWLRYCTPLTLFDRAAVVAGDSGAVPGVLVLYAAGIALFGAGITVFCRRDFSV